MAVDVGTRAERYIRGRAQALRSDICGKRWKRWMMTINHRYEQKEEAPSILPSRCLRLPYSTQVSLLPVGNSPRSVSRKRRSARHPPHVTRQYGAALFMLTGNIIRQSVCHALTISSTVPVFCGLRPRYGGWGLVWLVYWNYFEERGLIPGRVRIFFFSTASHPASYLVDIGGSFLGGKEAGAWSWTLISI